MPSPLDDEMEKKKDKHNFKKRKGATGASESEEGDIPLVSAESGLIASGLKMSWKTENKEGE